LEKLVCDKCGFELTDPEEIYLALDGTEAWQDAQRGAAVSREEFSL